MWVDLKKKKKKWKCHESGIDSPPFRWDVADRKWNVVSRWQTQCMFHLTHEQIGHQKTHYQNGRREKNALARTYPVAIVREGTCAPTALGEEGCERRHVEPYISSPFLAFNNIEIELIYWKRVCRSKGRFSPTGESRKSKNREPLSTAVYQVANTWMTLDSCSQLCREYTRTSLRLHPSVKQKTETLCIIYAHTLELVSQFRQQGEFNIHYIF